MRAGTATRILLDEDGTAEVTFAFSSGVIDDLGGISGEGREEHEEIRKRSGEHLSATPGSVL